jgi:uncharacterized protein (TIGR01777 family)
MTSTVFIVLAAQAVLGAFDNLWHHELEARLPQRVSARRELALHAAREAIYGLLFLIVAWIECRGAWAAVVGAMLAAEVVITLADFLEEDRTRRLPPLERLLHTVLTAMYGGFLALMVPVLAGWWHQPAALVFVPHGLVSWIFTAFAVGVLAWSVRNVLALRGTRPAPAAAAHAAPPPAHAPTVLVTGGTGFVGAQVVARLVRDGRRVIVLSRDLQQARANLGPAVTVIDRLDLLPAETRIDAIVHLAGARVLGMPWTRARRRLLIDSRVALTTALLALMRRLHHKPQVLVAASAVGFYGVPAEGGSMRGEGHEPLDESAPPRPGQFACELCIAAEHEARRAEALGVRVVRLRFGVILGQGDGAWPLQALAARLGLGTVLGTGRQPAPWLHIDDAVGLVRHAIDTPAVSGAVNAVAPEACTQAGFARTMAAAFGRRVWLRMPAAPLRLLGGEMMSLMLEGQAVAPAAALRSGYRFAHPSLAAACAQLARP